MDDFEQIVAAMKLDSRAEYADAIVELALVLQRADKAGSDWAVHLVNQLEFAVQRYRELANGG